MITCWNGRKLLEKNFASVLKAASNDQNRIVEVIVVDDGSTDDSVQHIQQLAISNKQLAIKVVGHKRNFGYATTCNTGVHGAKGDLVAILNLDVVPNEDFLKNALAHFENEKIFAVSFNEGKFGPGKIVWENGLIGIAPTEIPAKTVSTGWASGGSSVFRKDVWENLGGMDELFLPFYFEDIDLGIRAYKAGYFCLFEPEARVEHDHESTINPSNFKRNFIDNIKQRNRLLLTWKNIDSFNLLISHFAAVGKMCLKSPGYIKIVLISLSRWFTSSKKRSIAQNISTKDILKLNEKII